MLITQSAHDLLPVFKQGGVFAYPTEAIYGLGCDPDNKAAVMRLLALKQRPPEKGLILVAAHFSQVEKYLKPLSDEQQQQLTPGFTTYVLPAHPQTPQWLSGAFDTLAIRISTLPVIRELCLTLDTALVSTSANLSGEPPLMDFQAVCQWAQNLPEGTKIDAILQGETGGQRKPSRIVNALTGQVYRE